MTGFVSRRPHDATLPPGGFAALEIDPSTRQSWQAGISSC
jgi:hypothetical protein